MILLLEGWPSKVKGKAEPPSRGNCWLLNSRPKSHEIGDFNTIGSVNKICVARDNQFIR